MFLSDLVWWKVTSWRLDFVTTWPICREHPTPPLVSLVIFFASLVTSTVVTKCLRRNMLVKTLRLSHLATNINYLLTLTSGTNILKMLPTSKFSHQHPKIVAYHKLPTSRWQEYRTELPISKQDRKVYYYTLSSFIKTIKYLTRKTVSEWTARKFRINLREGNCFIRFCRQQLCWWHRYVDDLMMTDMRCWWQNHYVGDFFRYVSDFVNVLNQLLTSETSHQHVRSPTSVTNIDVTDFVCIARGLKFRLWIVFK